MSFLFGIAVISQGPFPIRHSLSELVLPFNWSETSGPPRQLKTQKLIKCLRNSSGCFTFVLKHTNVPSLSKITPSGWNWRQVLVLEPFLSWEKWKKAFEYIDTLLFRMKNCSKIIIFMFLSNTSNLLNSLLFRWQLRWKTEDGLERLVLAHCSLLERLVVHCSLLERPIVHSCLEPRAEI